MNSVGMTVVDGRVFFLDPSTYKYPFHASDLQLSREDNGAIERNRKTHNSGFAPFYPRASGGFNRPPVPAI